MKTCDLIVLVVLIKLVSCDQDNYFWGLNEDLNNRCTVQEGPEDVPVVDPCDLKSYYSCFNGLAIVQLQCPEGLLFHPGSDKKRCELAKDVLPLLPTECGGTQTNQKTGPPKYCAKGVSAVALEHTCRNYTMCTQGGPVEMQCPEPSYFIQETGRCIYLILPYKTEIPPKALQECERKDAENEEKKIKTGQSVTLDEQDGTTAASVEANQ